MRVKNSSLVLGSFRKTPSIADVTVLAPVFWTPRISMQRWLGKCGLANAVLWGDFAPLPDERSQRVQGSWGVHLLCLKNDSHAKGL